MDSDQLRIVLLILGVLLVVGIYAWDRVKKRGAQTHARRKNKPSRVAQHREPTLTSTDDKLDAPPSELGYEASAAYDQVEDHDRNAYADEPMLADPRGVDPEPGDEYSRTLDEASFSTKQQVPQKIILINIVTKGAAFRGVDILRAAKEVELEIGDMQIFHRQDAEHGGQVLFSMASMVEPGNFPVDDMSDFSSPGLTLFAQLPGPRDGLAIYSDLLYTGERLAVMLGGEMNDEKHNLLTKQWIEHTRAGILEHARQVQLARGHG